MKNTRVEELIASYLSGNLRAGEREELMTWVGDDPDHRTFFDKAVELWSMADQYTYPDFGANKEKAWDRLDERLFGEEQPEAIVRTMPRRRITWMQPWAAAAVILVVISAGLWWMNTGKTTVVASTLDEERKEIALPDGSQVWLNEESELVYEESDSERAVTLIGEGFFDVATDSLRPFRIYAGETVTTVLGTAFNIRAYPDEEQVEVTVEEGKVALEEQEVAQKRVELTPGETGVYELATAEVKTAAKPTVNATAWKERKLDFTGGISLGEAAASLERYFELEVQVENEDLLLCPVEGTYPEPKLETFVELFKFLYGVEVTQDSSGLVLKGGVCQ